MQIDQKTQHLFEKAPVRTALFKLSWPNIMMMFVNGTYTFVDSILAILLASRNYEVYRNYSPKDIVRLIMNGSNPIMLFIIAMTLLFGMGASVRFSINLGAKRHDKALVSMRSGFMSMLFVSLFMIVILLFTSKAWIGSLYGGTDPILHREIVNNAFIYLRVLIYAIPLQMFNQVISGYLRSEGRVKQTAFAMSTPIFVNLLFDYIFMGPMHMGIVGGAIATAMSYGVSTLTLIFFMFINKNSYVKFRNLFGFSKISPIALLGIFLVGIAPFLSNFAQSITGTFETSEIGAISQHFTGDPLAMRSILAGVFPIFGFAFPMIFGFVQGGTPIASYNYGNGNFDRVRQTYKWTVIYSCIFGLIMYALLAVPYLLGYVLLITLGVTGHNIAASQHVLAILMVGLPIFGATIGGMVLFASTDRLTFSILSNSFRGFIFFFPYLFLFQHLSILMHSASDINFFWWFYLAVCTTSSITTTVLSVIVLRRLERKNDTLDVRLQRIYEKFGRKSKVTTAV